MKRCPNCGQPTARTADWACQWCGYPILSKSYRKLPQTYQELKLGRLAATELEVAAETEMSPLPSPSPFPSVLEVEPSPEPSEVVKPKSVKRVKAKRRTEKKGERKTKPEVMEKTETAAEPELAAVEVESELKAEITPVKTPQAVEEAETEVRSEAEPEPEGEPEPDFGTEMESGAIKIGVDGLSAAYQVDKVGANERFKDKTLYVTGKVDKVIVRDSLDIYYIVLTGMGRAVWNVRCTFDKEHSPGLQRLTAGQSVAVQGKYAGYERNILLKDCAIVG